MNRLAMALIAYSVLGVLAFTTLANGRIRAATLLILALFAVKTWARRKEVLHTDEPQDDKNVEAGVEGPM